jgi:hypothetical protein
MARLPLLLLLLTGWTLPHYNAAADSSKTLSPFSAQYVLKYIGIPFGEVRVQLQLSTDGRYSYSAHTIPVGIAAMLHRDEVTEQSEGLIRDGVVTPVNYRYHHERERKPRVVSVDFNWRTHRVTNTILGSRWSMEIPPAAQDKFSQQLALMLALLRGETEIRFNVADGGRLKSYLFQREGEERATTEGGVFHCIKLSRSKNNNPSQATFWMAPELNYLPVRIERRGKNERATLELRSLRWEPASPTADSGND